MMDNIKTLPDPHMGKAFRTGVPLHRLGERERSQMTDLICSLEQGEETYHVCTGDLFDRFAVPNHVLLAVYEAYSEAAVERPDREFFILRGNHDGSRDINRISSFELLALMLRPFKNITVISDKPAVHAGGLGFIPWHPFKDAEEMADLRRSLMDGPETYHVCTGDLFDRFAVPNHILLAVYESYSVAACSRPDRQFIILRGNHDGSRDVNKISSFELLALMLRPFKNISVISDKPMIHASGMGFIPWHPFKDAEEMADIFVTGAKEVGTEIKVVFTHNDIEAFGDKVENLIPTKTLSQVTDLIVNGHIHTFIEQEFDRDGVHVILTGSMQPYTHAENPLGVLYRTLTLAEFDAMPPEDYRDLNIRLLLSPGQDLPTDVDCLSLTSKRLVLDEEGEQVDIEEFMNLDLGGLLAKRLAGNPLADQIMRHFHADETVS